MKSFLQQQQTLLETNNSIVEALKQNKDVLEQLKVSKYFPFFASLFNAFAFSNILKVLFSPVLF